MALGFGIVGCGMIADFHARAIARGSRREAGGLLRRRSGRSRPAGGDDRRRAYHDLDAMLADPAVTSSRSATPSGAHLEPAVAAARAGKHVIVEKPLEITLARCDKIIEACRQRRDVGHDLSLPLPRFQPEVEAGGGRGAVRPADAGRRLRQVVSGPQSYYDSGAWRGTWELDGGGALMNQAIHNVDLLAWLMGPVVEVRGRSACWPTADRGGRHGRGHAAVCQRGPGRDRGEHGGLSPAI